MIVGNKIKCNIFDYERELGIPSISAIELTNDTKKYVESYFLALAFTWEYLPKLEELLIYRLWYKNYYSRELLDLYDESIKIQELIAFKRDGWSGCELSVLENLMSGTEEIYIYGFGFWAKHIYNLYKKVCEHGKVKAFVVSDDQELKVTEYMNIPVIHAGKMLENITDERILVSVSSPSRCEIIDYLKKMKLYNIV